MDRPTRSLVLPGVREPIDHDGSQAPPASPEDRPGKARLGATPVSNVPPRLIIGSAVACRMNLQ